MVIADVLGCSGCRLCECQYARVLSPGAQHCGPIAVTRVQLFELVRYDFKGGLRARERTARLHLPTGAAHSPALTAELEVLEGLLRAAVVSSFEARATAYEDEACNGPVASRSRMHADIMQTRLVNDVDSSAFVRRKPHGL